MIVRIADPELIRFLAQASELVTIRDLKGNYLGTFAPAAELPAGWKPPPTEEEMEEEQRRKARGRSLRDILAISKVGRPRRRSDKHERGGKAQ